jgi:hypothetical protein
MLPAFAHCTFLSTQTAVAIYADIGGQPGVWQPEIWKLAEW